jgi:uncharacterized protein YkwD
MVRSSAIHCLCFVALALSVFSFRPAPLPAEAPPSISAASPPSMSADILRYVNEYRHTKHLSPLQANSFISSVALSHSRDMLSGKTPFGHDGFRERIDRLRKRLGPIHVAAENVASGPMGAREVVDGWLNSPGHRRNIEGDFRLTGIGIARRSDGMIYFTQIFTR